MNGFTDRAAGRGRKTRLAIIGAATAASLAAFAAPATAAPTSCDLVAAPTGSDSAPGTVEQPLRTGQALVDSLASGQTGCLRTGTYGADDEVKLTTSGITLTSYPGERATVKARLYVEQHADGATVSNLNLDGRNSRNLPSPTINADDVVFRANDVTNYHTEICFSIGSADTWGRAHRTLLEDNRIHDCGRLPSTNQDHGIYVNSADDTVIRNNLIYDNADRGVQLYPDAQGTLITGNVIDGNGEGVIFSGGSTTASSGNVVENNVITNSKIRDNIDSYWPGKVGTGNVVRNNCIGGGAYDDGDGGINGSSNAGFTATNNLLKSPDFANRAAGDYTIPASSPCAAILAGAATSAVKQPATGTGTDPAPSGDNPAVPALAVVTIDPAQRNVQALKPVRVSGKAPGADAVHIVIRRNGSWHRVGGDLTGKGGNYRMRIRLPHSGRSTLKAVAGGLRDSKPVQLRVKKQKNRG